MIQVTEFSQAPEPIVIEKNGGIANIWIRMNIHEEQREDDAIFIADEAFMCCLPEDAPTKEEIEEDRGTWFDYASEWQSEKTPTLEQLSAKVDYLEIMIGG